MQYHGKPKDSNTESEKKNLKQLIKVKKKNN